MRSRQRRGLGWTIEAGYEGPVAGIDEAGRGPLAGPVVAAAVIFRPRQVPDGLADSKLLTRLARERLAVAIRERALAFAIAAASVAEIDRLNILAASLLAMRRAVARLPVAPSTCLVDGNQDPGLGLPTECLVEGDRRCASIAAAGILAKVARDRIMGALARRYPAYGWAENAGYSVPRHREALELVGVSPHHRKSFAPVREIRLQYELSID